MEDTYTAGNWVIETTRTQMLSSAELSELEAALGGVKLPDMVFGNNTIRFTNEDADLQYYLSPAEALQLCSFEYR